jgi:hypothetical protein
MKSIIEILIMRLEAEATWGKPVLTQRNDWAG